MKNLNRMPRNLWMVKVSEMYDEKTGRRGKPGRWTPMEGIFACRRDARLEALVHRAKWGGKAMLVRYGVTQRELDRYHRRATADYARTKREREEYPEIVRL